MQKTGRKLWLLTASVALALGAASCAKSIPLRTAGVSSVRVAITFNDAKGCSKDKPCVATLGKAAAARFVAAMKPGQRTEPVKCAQVGTLEISYEAAATASFELRCSDSGDLYVSDSQHFYAIPKGPLVAAAKGEVAKLLP